LAGAGLATALMPGRKFRSIKGGKKGARQYEGLRKHGMSKTKAAKITNAAAKKRRKK
jgi:hypothetical protein